MVHAHAACHETDHWIGVRRRLLIKPVALVSGLGVATLFGTLLALVAPARAAFPGGNGLLAVQPLSGPGIVLIDANGRGERRVCAQPFGPDDRCGVTSPSRLLRPQWSPDGGTLVIDNAAEYSGQPPLGAFEVIYPDGSCLDCLGSQLSGLTDVGFTSDPTLLTAITTIDVSGGGSYQALVEYGIDGLQRSVLLSGGASDPVWSSRGELALVRSGWIWVGSPGTLRPVTQGSAPSWSPDGRQIVFVRRGWLMVGAVRGRSWSSFANTRSARCPSTP